MLTPLNRPMKFHCYLSTLLATYLLLPSICSAQQMPVGQQIANEFNILLLQSDSNIFSGYRTADWLEYESVLSADVSAEQAKIFSIRRSDSLSFKKRITRDSWLRYQTKDLTIVADPYLDAIAGKSNSKNGILWNGTAALRVRGNFRDKLTFGIGGYTSISEFPLWVEQYIATHNDMVPGKHQSERDNNGRYAYSDLDMFVNYMPDKHIALSAGYGKQFIGDGYRSLLLSDNAFNYPYLRLKASFWKLTYNATYSYLENDRVVDGRRQGKYSINHYFGATIGERLQVGFFENIIWVARDTNYQRGFEVQYINPLTFMRPIEFSLGSPDNSFFGFNWKYTLNKGYLYGQIALDDINIAQTFKNKKQHINNKYAIQLGIWTHELFLKNLSWRLEWNNVRPYTYGHRKIEQNYTHNHQSLTHPFGANFNEFISIFNYSKNRYFGILHTAYVIRGEQPNLGYNNGEDLWGGEENVPPLGSKTMQGNKVGYFFNRLSLGYIINPVNRLSVQADMVYRSASSLYQNNSNELYFGIGIRTGLFNRMDDI